MLIGIKLDVEEGALLADRDRFFKMYSHSTQNTTAVQGFENSLILGELNWLGLKTLFNEMYIIHACVVLRSHPTQHSNYLARFGGDETFQPNPRW